MTSSRFIALVAALFAATSAAQAGGFSLSSPSI